MSSNSDKERIVIGMLAHVDAGKTTLAEALLYESGELRRLGRVDHRDAYLDNFAVERERGITVFAKQAELNIGNRLVTLLDTPGHVDFSLEAERTLAVLDCAVLVVSAPEGVKGHTVTLWELLKKRRIPVFVFVNKLDLPSPSREAILKSLEAALGEGFVDFTDAKTRDENCAALSEALLDEYLERGALTDESVAEAVFARRVFPVYFGSALKLTGVDGLSDGLSRFIKAPEYGEEFAARVFKISRMDGQRLTFLKVTGGRLLAKQVLTNRSAAVPEDEVWEEKADRLLVYSGAKYTLVPEAPAGAVCAAAGLTRTKAGEGLGREAGVFSPELSPVLSYAVIPEDGRDAFEAFRQLASLSEEEPGLGIVWDEQHREIRARLMGEVQCEVLSRLISDRFGFAVTFGEGAVMYRETVANAVTGVGHFEPLRHYAHVEVKIEPAPAGSGIAVSSEADPRALSPSWQRAILGCLSRKRHRGVLTGAPLTDVNIILTSGMAHLKHTEGGDFMKAASRAVRQALMKAENVLLEPYYAFRLELPEDCVGRAMTDIKRMNGEFSAPSAAPGLCVLTGFAPVACMRDYAKTVSVYTKGKGVLSLSPADYRPCRNAREVVETIGYDPEADLKNTPDSVFCAAGAGFTVKWYEVEAYLKRHSSAPSEKMPTKKPVMKDEEDELKAIFERTYGRIEGVKLRPVRKEPVPEEPSYETADEYLLVDGYNVIFAWESLSLVARDSIDLAREALIRMMINFSATRRGTTILVFDAYKVTGGVEKVEKIGGVFIVYTRESEIADVFIERAVEKLEGTKRRVRVVTSDGTEQLIVMGRGALRVPSPAFEKEVRRSSDDLKRMMDRINSEGKAVVHLWEKLAGAGPGIGEEAKRQKL